jgi:hypothetical protein
MKLYAQQIKEKINNGDDIFAVDVTTVSKTYDFHCSQEIIMKCREYYDNTVDAGERFHSVNSTDYSQYKTFNERFAVYREEYCIASLPFKVDNDDLKGLTDLVNKNSTTTGAD